MVMTEGGSDVVHIGHRAYIDPGLRYCDNNIGEAKAEPLDKHDVPVGFRNHLANEVFAGDAKMNGSRRELACDFGCGQVSDLDIVEPGDRATVVARPPRLDQRQPRAHEERLRILLQAALGRNGEDKRPAHGVSP